MIPFHCLCVPGELTDHKEEVNLQEIWYQDLTQLLGCTTGQKSHHKQPLTGLLWWWLLSSSALWTECSCIVFKSYRWGEDCSHTGWFWGWDFASHAQSVHLGVLCFCRLSWRGGGNKLYVRCRIFCICPLESSTEIRGPNLGMTNLQIPVVLLDEGSGQIPPSLCVSIFSQELPNQWLQQMGPYEEKEHHGMKISTRFPAVLLYNWGRDTWEGKSVT